MKQENQKLHAQSELKLPPILNKSQQNMEYLKDLRVITKGTSEGDETRTYILNRSNENDSILNMLNSSLLLSTVSQHSRSRQYFPEKSLISSETGRETEEKYQFINIFEQKKLKNPEYETNFDLQGFLNSKSDKDKNIANQHYVLQADLKTYFYIEKKSIFAKISTVGKTFPMKVKLSGSEGPYDLFFSFFDPFPDKDNSIEAFPQRQEHLYRFNQPKGFSQQAYICISSKQSAKVELKVWFTDEKLEKFRSKNFIQPKVGASRSMNSLKEKLKVDLTEGELKNLQFEEIRERQAKKYKLSDKSMIEKNRDLAGKFHLLQRKKEFDFITHQLHCDEVVQRNVSIQLSDYQEKYSKYFSKILTHRHNMEKISKAKKQKQIKSLTSSWVPFIFITKLVDIIQDKIYMYKLSDIFKGRVTRVFLELARNFKGQKLEQKPYLNDKQRLLSDILLSMNVKAKQLRKMKKKMAAKVLVYFFINQKQNAIMNSLVSLSKRMLHHVTLIQKKRKQNLNNQKFISMKMLDGIIEKLKDEDFKLKKIDPDAREQIEISFYSNYLKKKDKEHIVLAFLRTVKDKFKRMLMLSRGQEETTLNEEERLILELEAKNVARELKNGLGIVEPSAPIHQNQMVAIQQILEEANQQNEDNQQSHQDPGSQDSHQNVNNAITEQNPNKQKENTRQSISIMRQNTNLFTGKYNLSTSDYKLIEIIRITQIKMRIIQNRPILQELVLKKLNEIKKEREEAASDMYITQQAK